jgi:hypothetical protein
MHNCSSLSIRLQGASLVHPSDSSLRFSLHRSQRILIPSGVEVESYVQVHLDTHPCTACSSNGRSGTVPVIWRQRGPGRADAIQRAIDEENKGVRQSPAKTMHCRQPFGMGACAPARKGIQWTQMKLKAKRGIGQLPALRRAQLGTSKISAIRREPRSGHFRPPSRLELGKAAPRTSR